MHSPLFRMRDCCCCIKDVFHAARQGVTSSRSRTVVRMGLPGGLCGGT
jgi:hypothetical protein